MASRFRYGSPLSWRLRLLGWRLRRGAGRLSIREKAALAALVAILLAGAGHGVAGAVHPHHTSSPPATVAVAPNGGSYTPASWAAAFLGTIREPATACNLAAIQSWEAAEGGNWNNNASYNPLNTTEREPGSWSVNYVGVQAFPSWQEGFLANSTVITNGLYGGILAALRVGDNAQAVANAVASSPWGTSPFESSC